MLSFLTKALMSACSQQLCDLRSWTGDTELWNGDLESNVDIPAKPAT